MCDISTEEQLLEIAKSAAETGVPLKFEFKKHIAFLIRHLNVFPQPYNSLETSRNTIFLFAISSLDLLGELDSLLTPERRKSYIDWIYGLQFTKAPVLFNEPLFRDLGVRWLGQRGFGGILMAPATNSDEQMATVRTWIPQYNLRNFWRYQIPSIPVGLIEPLIPPRCRKPNDFDRLPGPFSYKTEDSEVYNRNLLAARYYENSEKLKIWTVNERSKRHYLECYQVEINESGHPLPSSQLLLSDHKLKMVPPEKFYPDAEHFPREPLLEVRTSNWNDSESTILYLRSPTLLRMLRQDEKDPMGTRNELFPIFNRAVKYFAESDLLNNQLAVVDHGGRVWMFDMHSENPENAQKVEANTDEVYQRVAFSDHPQILAFSGNWHVETVDLRSSGASKTCQRLWDSPIFESRQHGEPKYVQESPPPPAVIRHLERIPGTANMFLIMTNHAMHLLDDRFPGKTVIHVKHPIGSGAHKMVVSQGVKDPKNGGVVYSIYCLDHANRGVSMTSLYLHPSGIWSSVDAFHSLGQPHDFNEAARRGKYAEGERIAPEPTRAICLVERVGGDKDSVLIRQLDDGSVWWQTISGEAEISETKLTKLERESAERIRETREMDERWKRQPWRPVFSDGMSRDIRESPMDGRKLHRLEVSGMSRSICESFSKKSKSLLRKCREIRPNPELVAEKLRVQPLDDVKSVLSEIVMDHFKQTNEHLQKVHGDGEN